MSTNPSSSAFTTPFLPSLRRRLPQALKAPTLPSLPHNPFTARAVQTPSLPTAADLDTRAKRNHELEENQKLYVYKSPPTIPGIAFIQGPPSDLPGQSPKFAWWVRTALSAIRVVLNFASFNPNALFNVFALVFDLVFNNLQDKDGLDNVAQSFNDKTDTDKIADSVIKRWKKARISGSQFEEKNPILEPYREMWKVLDLPPIANVFLEDEVFARLRVAGYNPITLKRVFTRDDCPFDIDDADLPDETDSVISAIAQNRLYFLDYSAIASIQQQVNSNKIYTVCKAIFVVPPGGGDLAPVAISVNGDVIRPPKPDAPFDTKWAIAKMALNNDDAIHHELVAHLGRTHLLVEPFIAATMRQLPSDHPLHVLLKPHFEGTVFINDTASRSLVAPGGDVDRIFAGEIASVMAWCADLVINNKFNASMPDVEMKARGVMDPILDMPYREDALEHFDAMHEWVHSYLSHYYKSDDEIVADVELQNWAKELVDDKRGRVKDFGEDGNGKLTSLKYLSRAITFIIFSGSVQHAAVNFPQMAFMSYAPAVAGALWGVPPASDEPSDLDKWESILTPIKTAVEGIKILGIIGTVYYTQLGKYRRGEMPDDPEIKAALSRYHNRLNAIDKRIEARESKSKLKYDFMRPGNVPQSINI